MEIMRYIKKYFLELSVSILLSVFFVFFIIPIVLKIIPLRGIFFFLSKDYVYTGFISIVAACLLLSFKRLQKLLERYKNTFLLDNPPFIHLDAIVLFLLSTFILLYFFPQFKLKPEFIKRILYPAGILIFMWMILVMSPVISKFKNIINKLKKQENQENKEQNKDKNEDIYFLSDEPIKQQKEDLLNRGKFVEDLFKQIIKWGSEDPIVFALNGSWGEGKTSVLNLLRDKIKNNNKFLIMNFEPWYFKDEEAILNAFYSQLEHTISEKFIFTNLIQIIKKYLSMVKFGILESFIEFNLNYGNDVNEIKCKIEKFISQTGKKIIILIDDIDRLDSKEILLIFKLVRCNAKLKNTIFILTFDDVYVRETLEKYLKIDNSNRNYIEKIVQFPIALPEIEQQDINNFLFLHLDKLLKENDIKIDDKFYTFGHFYKKQLVRLFKTLRHAKRYINAIRVTLPPIIKEVNPYDFFLIEIIRIFYPKIYDDIWEKPWYYIPISDDFWYYVDGEFPLSPFYKVVENNFDRFPDIKKHIEEITQSEDNKEVLIEVLKELFIEVKNAFGNSRKSASTEDRIEKRITHPECFKKYFIFRVPSREISDEFIETIINRLSLNQITDEEFKNIILAHKKNERLYLLLDKLTTFRNKINKEGAKKIIKIISENSNEFSNTEDPFKSEIGKAEYLLMLLINEKFEKEEIQSILEEIISTTPSFIFAMKVFKSCKEKSGVVHYYNIYQNIIIDILRNKLSARLKKYFIDGKKDVFIEFSQSFGWQFILYQWAIMIKENPEEKEILSNYVISLISNDIEKFINFTFRFDLYKAMQVCKKEKLIETAKKFEGDNISDEQKAILKSFLAQISNPIPKTPDQIKMEIKEELIDIFFTKDICVDIEKYRLKHENERNVLDELIKDGLIVKNSGYYHIHPKVLTATEKGRKFFKEILDPFIEKLKEKYRKSQKFITEKDAKTFYNKSSEDIRRIFICLSLIPKINNGNFSIFNQMSFTLTESILDFNKSSEEYFKS